MDPEIAFTVAMAGWGATAIAAYRYRRQLHTDPLTGIGNRAALYRRARRHRMLAGHRGVVGLLMVDLDHFKALNDTYGHDVGNRVLVAVAARLAETAHHGELAVRLHGDEFAVWLGRTTRERSEIRASDIAEALTAPVWVDGHPVTATGSVGLALAPSWTTVADLLGQADARMYATKGKPPSGVNAHPFHGGTDLTATT